ncbi:hypothetical protein CM19_08805 [Candidatus Acidianus copahuensis]|uniref:Uncharacterized protein n=1 Tax=Candidatus Acidianus copahuensis TaxID=1160895 RepID=A0A031LNZ3_9CREN|nr:hypothetical protein [Candidatus Acidianus copahuensis]EZQ03814.1 hypothetical protein CM19_08805 [Candidatus Acidianus copahuensis]
MNREDKILLLRGIIGLIAGLISIFVNTFILALLYLIIGYIISIVVVAILFHPDKKWNLLGKGVLTLIIAWFLILLVIYNIIV